MSLPRLQLFETQGLLDLEVAVLVFKKAYSNTYLEFHSTADNSHLKQQLMFDVENRKTCSVMPCPGSSHELSLSVLMLRDLDTSSTEKFSDHTSPLNITSQFGKTSQKEKSLSHSKCYIRHVRNCKIKELIISMGNVNAMSDYIVFMEN